MKQEIISITEEWLRTAVEQLDKYVFDGELDIADRGYQIYYGRVRGKRGGESVLPSQMENITVEDFFPITIGIDYQIRDIDVLMATLAMECIVAFITEGAKGKRFKKACERFYFEAPFNTPTPSPYLRDLLNEAYEATVKAVGPFPGKAVKFPVKEKKEKKTTKAIFVCPDCGLELTASLKQLKNNGGTPTCICGARMIREIEETEDGKVQEETNA